MGFHSYLMISVQERGYSDIDTHICTDCVENDFLKSVIQDNLTENSCSYCDSSEAADVNELLPYITDTINYYYADPASAGVPRDSGEWVCSDESFLNIEEILCELGLDANEDFIADLCEAIEDNWYVKAYQGHYYSSSKSEVLSSAWSSFSHVVKYQTRYMFKDIKHLPEDIYDLSPAQFLTSLANIIKNHGLVDKLPSEFKLYRARARTYNSEWDITEKTLGAPPNRKASSGRMNPIGISYLYTATDENTAIEEVVTDQPKVAIGEFQTLSELNILDLTKLPTLPSVFDPEKRDELQYILFLKAFQKEITKPISKDGSEHIDYVPTQVISEYFAHNFYTDKMDKLNGIRYKSSKSDSGHNIVLFPLAFGKEFSSIIEFNSSKERDLLFEQSSF